MCFNWKSNSLTIVKKKVWIFVEQNDICIFSLFQYESVVWRQEKYFPPTFKDPKKPHFYPRESTPWFHKFNTQYLESYYFNKNNNEIFYFLDDIWISQFSKQKEQKSKKYSKSSETF